MRHPLECSLRRLKVIAVVGHRTLNVAVQFGHQQEYKPALHCVSIREHCQAMNVELSLQAQLEKLKYFVFLPYSDAQENAEQDR